MTALVGVGAGLLALAAAVLFALKCGKPGGWLDRWIDGPIDEATKWTEPRS